MKHLEKYTLIKFAKVDPRVKDPYVLTKVLAATGGIPAAALASVIGAIYGVAKPSNKELKNPKDKTTVMDRIVNMLAYGAGGGLAGGVIGAGTGAGIGATGDYTLNAIHESSLKA